MSPELIAATQPPGVNLPSLAGTNTFVEVLCWKDKDVFFVNLPHWRAAFFKTLVGETSRRPRLIHLLHVNKRPIHISDRQSPFDRNHPIVQFGRNPSFSTISILHNDTVETYLSFRCPAERTQRAARRSLRPRILVFL